MRVCVCVLDTRLGYIKTDLSLNALTGSGTSYGKMDETTAKGYEPAYVAQRYQALDLALAIYKRN